MAQLQDIIAKRKELMGANSNLSYTDAMAQARQQVAWTTPTVTPSTPVTPAVTPTPVQTPTPVPSTPVQPSTTPTPAPAPTQPTDWMGDFSQIKKREPVAPIPVTPEPVTPTPSPVTTEPVKTTVKPEAPVINRQQEIQNNLTTGYNTNPALFSDRTAFNQAYNYATKSPEEQATLDSFYNSKQPTISSMYSAIVNKQEVPDSTKMTPAYKIAQNRYSKASMYSSMTPTQVSDEMRNAKLVEGSQAFEDLKAINPKLVQDATNLRKVNGDTTNIWTTNADGTKINNLEKNIADDYTDNFGEFIKSMYKVYTPAEITAIIRTPDVVAAEDKAFSIEKSINELDKQIDNIDSDIDTEQKWGGATGSRIALEKASRREKLIRDRDSFVREYTMYANNAKKIIDQNTVSFQTQQQQQQDQNAAMLPFIQDQYKTAQAKKQAEFELNDPATAIKSIMDEMAKIWVTSNESLQTKIQKAKEYIANGGTLAGYIDEMKKLYTDKPEYKAYVAKQSGTEWQSTNITRYNPSTGANESTPIFYRKKTNGGFEAVDLAGNPIDANLIWWTGGWTPSSTYPATSFTGDTTSYIASKEWFRDKAYQDSAGVWTIWYGTTRINGKPIQPGQTITQAEAQKLLWQDIASHSTWKTLIDPNTLSPAQQTALASFEYNLWPGIWNKSAMNIIDMVKSGNLKGAADEMKKYNRAGWKVVQGLVNRRNDEANMLLNSSQNTTTTQQEYSPDKIKSFEAFNGTTFPSDYKTPAQQKQYRDEYNAWRASRPGTKIEKWKDITDLKLWNQTESNQATQAYTARMIDAVNNLIPLEKAYMSLWVWEKLKQQYLPSLLKSSDQKLIDLNKKNFITAVLRKQSGASIATSEFEWEELKYFPQPWDSKEVIIAKQNARNAEIKAMLSQMWSDTQWNQISSYYNPPVFTQENVVNNAPTDKITTLKNKYF